MMSRLVRSLKVAGVTTTDAETVAELGDVMTSTHADVVGDDRTWWRASSVGSRVV